MNPGASTAVVIGCGGTIGGAWSIAALAALAEQTGWDPREAAILQGTSAGAEIVTMLGAGFSTDDLVAMQLEQPVDARLARHLADTPSSLPPLPWPQLPRPGTLGRRGGHLALTGLAPRGRGNPDWLGRLADAVTEPGQRWLPRTGVRLVSYRPDDDRRVAFTDSPGPTNPNLSGGATLSEALRASWASPAWMPPVEIDGRTYVDGGAASTASVDLIPADEADMIYVITSMAGLDDVHGPGVGGRLEATLLRRPMSAVLTQEVARVRARGTRVVVVSPTAPEMAELGANFMRRGRRGKAFAAARHSSVATVAAALAQDASA